MFFAARGGGGGAERRAGADGGGSEVPRSVQRCCNAAERMGLGGERERGCQLRSQAAPPRRPRHPVQRSLATGSPGGMTPSAAAAAALLPVAAREQAHVGRASAPLALLRRSARAEQRSGSRCASATPTCASAAVQHPAAAPLWGRRRTAGILSAFAAVVLLPASPPARAESATFEGDGDVEAVDADARCAAARAGRLRRRKRNPAPKLTRCASPAQPGAARGCFPPGRQPGGQDGEAWRPGSRRSRRPWCASLAHRSLSRSC